MDEEKIESEKITISIGLIASLLTIIYLIDKFVSFQNSSISNLIKIIMYTCLGLSGICFFVYLVLKGAGLRKRNPERLGYFGVPITPKGRNFFFDEGIDLILISPLIILSQIFLIYLPEFITKITGWSQTISVIIGFVLFFILNIVVALITKKSREEIKRNLSKS